MFRPARAVVLAVAAFLMVPMVLAAPDEGPDGAAAVCAQGLRTMEGVGLVCPREGGLYEIFTTDLVSLGFTHGTDPVPPPEALDEGVGIAGSTSPVCQSGAAGTYYIQVIYAQASNGADNYAAKLNMIRYLVGQANALVDNAGIATGGPASLKVKCVSGLVEVKKEILPTSTSGDSFSSVVTDLRNKGYNDGKVKYWVFYDRTDACSCGGTGHVYNDDSLAITNFNNGNAASMFAVNFGYNSTRIWLHELGHNMGAVQNSAPHSTLGYHCYDGLDTMCYNDGAANGSLYSPSYCATEIFDCGKTDYFHASPPAGSYLATHWNLGNSLNRFIAFGTPSLTSLTCPSSVETHFTFTCTFVASDDSSGVKYTLTWGDGTTTTVPSSGYVTPGVMQSASKSYTTAGTRTVSVTPTDSAGFVGNTLSRGVTAFLDTPTMVSLTCPASVEQGASTSCSFRANDQSPGVKYTVSWGDGSTTNVPASGYVAPNTTQAAAHAYATTGTKTVTVTPTDSLSHVGAAMVRTVSVFYDLTPPTLVVVDPAPSTVYSGCGIRQDVPAATRAAWVATACVSASATDAKSGIDRVEVYVAGVLQATDVTAPYVFEFPVPDSGLNVPVEVRAYDGSANMASATVSVDMVAGP